MLKRKIVMTLLLPLFTAFFIFGVYMYFFQEKLIYFPRKYEENSLQRFPQNLIKIKFSTSQGEQTAFYLAEREVEKQILPRNIWIVTGGNGSVALGWLDFLSAYQEEHPYDAFLLIDYPGYGFCAGKPSLATIRETAKAAVEHLAHRFQISVDTLAKRAACLGHSLGAAVALFLAEEFSINRVVLIAPFTTLKETAKKHYPLFYFLLKENYDNRKTLDRLKVRMPQVTIVHGERDRIVPVSMGKQLGEEYEFVHFISIANGEHNSIIELQQKQIHAVMAGDYEKEG